MFKIIFLILSWPQSGGPTLAIFRFFSHTQCHIVDHTYIYICVYVYIYIHVSVYVYIYTHTHIIIIYAIIIFPSKITTFDRQIQILVGSTSNLLLTSPVFCFTRQWQGRDAVPPPKPKSCKRSEDTSAWKWRKWDLRGVLLTSTRQPEMSRG